VSYFPSPMFHEQIHTSHCHFTNNFITEIIHSFVIQIEFTFMIAYSFENVPLYSL